MRTKTLISKIFSRKLVETIRSVGIGVGRFTGQLLRLLVCHHEKFGAQIQKHVKELVGHEMSPALFSILFDQIKAVVEKFFDQQGQVRDQTVDEDASTVAEDVSLSRGCSSLPRSW